MQSVAATGEADSRSPGNLPLGRLAVTAASVSISLGLLLWATSRFEVLAHSTTELLRGSTTFAATAAGGAAGALHTLAGPDHLAALAPLVTGGRRTATSAFFLGALWGSGHATGQVVLGLACLAARAGFAPHAPWAAAAAKILRRGVGGLVGVALIFIGVLGFREVIEARREAEKAAGQAEEGIVSGDSATKRYGWTTFATGVVHGLQPDALLFIMPALALPVKAAVGFVVAFGVGTLVSMGICAVLLAMLCNNPGRVELISTTASSIAVVLGVTILLASLGLEIPVLSR